MAVAETSPEWAIGFQDECWWSRLALLTLSSWAKQGKPMRLVQQSVAKGDPEPKAISCYGLFVPLDCTKFLHRREWCQQSVFLYGRVADGARTRDLLQSHNPPTSVSWRCCRLQNRLTKQISLLVAAKHFCVFRSG